MSSSGVLRFIFFFTYTLSSFYFISFVSFLFPFPLMFLQGFLLPENGQCCSGSAGREFFCFFFFPNSLHRAVLQTCWRQHWLHSRVLAAAEQYFHSIKDFVYHHPQSKEAWVGQEAWAVTWPGQQTPADQKYVPYHMPSWLVIRCWGKEEKRGDICG